MFTKKKIVDRREEMINLTNIFFGRRGIWFGWGLFENIDTVPAIIDLSGTVKLMTALRPLTVPG